MYNQIVHDAIATSSIDNTYSAVLEEEHRDKLVPLIKWGTAFGLPQWYIGNKITFYTTALLFTLTVANLYKLDLTPRNDNFTSKLVLILVALLVAYTLFSAYKGYLLVSTNSPRMVLVKTIELKGFFAHTTTALNLDLIMVGVALIALAL